MLSRYELRYGASLRQDADRFSARLQRELLPVVASCLPVSVEIAERGGIKNYCSQGLAFLT